jgi:hypothetical protein
MAAILNREGGPACGAGENTLAGTSMVMEGKGHVKHSAIGGF